MTQQSPPRVLLLGWDAADWRFIRPLLERGHMPALERLMNEGAWGALATQQPVLSPMLWTTIATGKRPYQHGIHGFIEPMPDGKGMRASGSTTRACKALWNIATQSGLRSNIVGWYCSHPAEPINGVCVSDMYHHITSDTPAEWKPDVDAIYPTSLADDLLDLRLHPTQLVPEQLLAFVPGAARIDQSTDRRPAMLAKLLCEMVNVHSAATWLIEHQPWDFMAVYHTAIDHFGHYFMQYHPPQMEGVSDQDFEMYKDVMVGCYRFHDMMLARMMELAGEETNLILCSDHGFHSNSLRPRAATRGRVDPPAWHRSHGIVCLHGPSVRRRERVYGASILDIAPTVLTLLGLPIGEDMEGKPLLPVLAKDVCQRAPARVPSWETVEGEAGMHPPEKREDPFGALEAVRQLIDLGYIEKPDPKAERAASQASRQGRLNLALSNLDAGRLTQAIELLEAMWREDSPPLRAGSALVWAYLAARRNDIARSTLEEVLQRARETADHYGQVLEQRRLVLLERIEHGRKEPAGASARTPEQLEQRVQLIEQAQQRMRDLNPRALPRVQLLLGLLEAADRNHDQALVHLQAAGSAEHSLPAVQIAVGRVYFRLKRFDEALQAFTLALEKDSESATGHNGMAGALLKLGRPRQAAHHALRAVELLYQLPQAHYRLGLALTRLGEFDRAIDAFETCSKMAPRFEAPLRRLMRLYERLEKPHLAAICLNKIDAIRQSHQGERPPLTAEQQP